MDQNNPQNNPAKKLSLQDDAIKKVTAQVQQGGKTQAESHKELFERINNLNSKEVSSPVEQGEEVKEIDIDSGEVIPATTETEPAHNPATPVEPQAAPTAPTQNTPSSSKLSNSAVVRNLRTYQGDVAEAMKKNNTSTLSITMAERKREEAQKKEREEARRQQVPVPQPIATILPQPKRPPAPPKKQKVRTGDAAKRIGTIAVSIFLIVLGVVVVFGFYTLQKSGPPTVAVNPLDETLVPVTGQVSYNANGITRDTLLEIINFQRNEEEISSGEILHIALAKEQPNTVLSFAMTTQEFLDAINVSPPPIVERSLDEELTLGMYHVGTPEPFILIRLDSFENAFSGMLRWESSLYDDLGIFFSRTVLSQTSAATTTQGGQTSQVVDLAARPTTPFEDITIRNRDARVLRNNRGEIVLLYAFIDREILLITGSDAIFREISQKIQSSRLIR